MSRFLIRMFPVLLLLALALVLSDGAPPVVAQGTGTTPLSCPHTSTITGRVVLDKDLDGVGEAREPGIGGWEVQAKLADNPQCAPEDLPKATADANGRFRFSKLVPGTYYLNYSAPDNLGLKRWVVWSPDIGSGSDGERVWVTRIRVEVADADTAETSIEVMPIEGTASVSGLLYFDSNRSGVHDPEEPLFDKGMMILLGYRTPKGYALVHAFDSELSGGPTLRGRYEFSELAPGDYVVGVIGPPSKPVNPPADANGFANGPVTLSRGEQRTGVDFGFESRAPKPTVSPTLAALPMPATPAPDARLAPPVTGTGGASPEGGLAGFAAALAVAGSLAVSGSVLVGRRWRACLRR